MTWNYRVIRLFHPLDGDYLEIREVYYDVDGEPTSVVEDGARLGDETIEGIRSVMKMMEAALDKPILDYTIFD